MDRVASLGVRPFALPPLDAELSSSRLEIGWKLNAKVKPLVSLAYISLPTICGRIWSLKQRQGE
jgi:hypothetical protein